MKNFLLVIAFCILVQNVKGQSLELDYFKGKAPSISKEDMQTIGMTIINLVEIIKKTPNDYLAKNDELDTVYSYFSFNSNTYLEKVNPKYGLMYNNVPSIEIAAFRYATVNLIFDGRGKLILQDKLGVILYDDKGSFNNCNFKVNFNDTLRTNLNQVKLNGNHGVQIKIPITVFYFKQEGNTYEGVVTKQNEKIDVNVDGYILHPSILESLKKALIEKTDIINYKKGRFNFKLNYSDFSCNTDYNIIVNGGGYSAFNKSFQYTSIDILDFNGKGKRID